MAKTPTKKPAEQISGSDKTPRVPRKAKSASQREQDAAKKVEAGGGEPDPQSGMQRGPDSKAKREAAQQEQFSAADDKAREAIGHATLSRAVRGW